MGGARGSTDGRVLRGQRNRDSVVEAFLSLIEEGEPRPTARLIADRAGLSVRSVFQHFAELETIYEAAGRRQLRKMGSLFDPVDPTIPLERRLPEFVARRCTALEELDPVARSARLREPFSAQLQANRTDAVRRMRDQVRSTFAPELDELVGPDPDRAADVLIALATTCSWSSWYHLRNDQGLDVGAAARVVGVGMSLLLRSDAPHCAEVRLPR